ncbi:MAG TPA: tetratricopeptide repeat protein [Anaerolineales bacterium]|nr:tetratricopeptide repeat protein [Anaerolineales bacterium]
MRLSEDNLTFRTRRSADPYRLLLWAGLILAGLWLLVQVDNDKIVVFEATPTPTRTAGSFSQEGQAWFAAGNLDAAIEAYNLALEDAPNDPRLLAERAQIQVYSSALRTTDAERKDLLLKAKADIELAATLAERDSFVHAIRALVLDWNANPNLVTPEERTDLLFQAENAAVLARELDNNNALALAYYAEILLDGGKLVLAEESILAALDANDQLMDVHRIYGQVLETKGLYVSAIEEYERAAGLAPNLTFLYLYVGYNYRQLALQAQLVDVNSPVAKERFGQALDAFARAASINSQIGVKDPIPYLAIAKTYAQQGEFFIAARNGEKALEFDPENPAVYGQLGRIYMQARNYETALPTLKCAVVGCTAEENEVGKVQVEPLALTSLEVAYYYVFYDSVLSALNKCEDPDVTFVRDELRKSYGEDPVIPSIIAENEEICRILAQSGQ